jgi:hypothetical protein
MERLVWLLVLVGFGAVIASLGFGLVHLSRGGADDSRRLARALTLRITVSLVLFALLLLAWYFGLIKPHALGSAVAAHP